MSMTLPGRAAFFLHPGLYRPGHLPLPPGRDPGQVSASPDPRTPAAGSLQASFPLLRGPLIPFEWFP